MALRADERRDKLRKASGRSKYPLIRRHVRENARFLHDFRRVSVRVRVRDYGAEYHDIAPIHGLTSFRDNVFIR